jgi:hypothetical protein
MGFIPDLQAPNRDFDDGFGSTTDNGRSKKPG